MLYLKRHQNLGLQLDGDDKYMIASDASFTDNSADQKSSQNYAIKLFEDLVEWQANKQAMIITSIIKVELLALSQAAREEIYIRWLLRELQVKMNSKKVII